MKKEIKAIASAIKSEAKSIVGFFATPGNKVAFMMFFAFGMLMLFPEGAMAADPIATMKEIYLEQARTNAFPVLIVWILALGVVISFSMGKWMPFILAIVASVVIAVTPDIAPSFTFDEFNTTTP